MILLTLPYPPSANHIWRTAGKRVYRSKRYMEWLEEAAGMAIGQRQGGIKGPYKISIDAVRPDKRVRDLGNLEKPISDLLVQIGTIEDDKLAEMICIRWVTNGEGVTVRIEKAGIE